MKRYLNQSEETNTVFWGEWFKSGDIGYQDEEGYLFIVDRLKDMVITGGENVYPRKIEEIRYSFPEVQACAVIGLPDKKWGQRVTAVVIFKPFWTIEINNLKSILKSCLSPFKVPKEYHVVEALPKRSMGKILKKELIKNFQH